MQCTEVFNKNAAAYNQGSKLIVNQGGTRSSKTYSILQIIALIALYSKTKKIISVVSYALPHLKLGAMRDFEDILESLGVKIKEVKNIADSTFYINKCIVEFFGTENLGKVHGPARDILFVNEANFMKYSIYEQLAIRTKDAVFIDFNPSREFWYHEHIQDKIEHTYVHSTYLDNEFLTATQIARIEEKRANEHWWRVYGEGLLGRMEGAIFTNWVEDCFPNNLAYNYGLDFGLKDPDAFIKAAVDRAAARIYLSEELYNSGLSTPELYNNVRKAGSSLILADSASARTILDLQRMGLNIEGVKKNKITDDIKALQGYELVVDPQSYNLIRELNNYVWLDKKGELPIDYDNHLLDAMRYAVMHIIQPRVKPTMKIR